MAKFCGKKVQCSTTTEGPPTTNRQRRMQQMVARLKELQCQIHTFNKRETEGKEILEVEFVQLLQPWRNTTKDAVEEEPYAPWLEKAKKERKKAAKDKMNEDMKNGGAAAHKAVKGALGSKKEYVQPTHKIATKDGISSEPKKVHQAFKKEWEDKVFRLQREKPNWERFKEKYGNFIPKVPYTYGIISGEDLHQSVQRMGKTVPGLDGWRIHELKLLGKDAWKQRARIVEVQFKTGKVPKSYKQVSTPMMPKTKGTEKLWTIEGSLSSRYCGG